jgi:transitional endoplasmic reticulum ATPase
MSIVTSGTIHAEPAQLASPLSPTQSATLADLLETVRAAPVTVLTGPAGSGKTTLLAHLSATLGDALRISTKEMLRTPPVNHGQSAIEETLHHLIADAVAKARHVIVEDIDLVCNTNRMSAAYVRPYYFQVALQALFEAVRSEGKRLIFSATLQDQLLPVFDSRCLLVGISAFTPADYQFFLGIGLGGERARSLDHTRIYSAAPKLSGYQLLEACALARDWTAIDDDRLIELISSRVLTSNVSLGEVAKVEFADLKGFDDIIHSLETHVAIPMQAARRFPGLGLAPKRGVLLFGPPGTGKTSVGRALAHRLKGKFFMIDGTFTSEPPAEFYAKVKRVFERAKHNTPSVIFIDDADVLMQSDRIYGLNRYLLTMLDGLESETAGKVTVMMTAMDPNQLPQALLRSGRVELWLETKLPDADARLEILASTLRALPDAFRTYDASAIAALTEGFTGADMKRVVADVKAFYAHDVISGDDIRTPDAYLEAAATGIRANKALLLAAQQGTLKLSRRSADER